MHRTVLALFALFPSPLLFQSNCNTQDNPTCGKDKRFDALCCPYPNICYWANRQQEAACCPAGQTCLTGGSAGEPVSTIRPVVQTTLSTIRESTTFTQPPPPPTTTASIVPIVPVTSTLSTVQNPVASTTTVEQSSTRTTRVAPSTATVTGQSTTVVTTGTQATTPPTGPTYVTGDGTLVVAQAGNTKTTELYKLLLWILATIVAGIEP